MRTLLLSVVLATAAQAAEPVQVMVLGTFHMSNPGHDLHNQKVDDVLAPKRQAEIAAVTDGLSRFKPTLVVVEWPKALVEERYQKYLDQTLEPARNEVVQLGFRLGRLAKARVLGIDVDGDFPYDKVKAWADAHSRGAGLEEMSKAVEISMRELAQALDRHGVNGELRLLNDPANVVRSHTSFYPAMLRYGASDDQPGVALLTAWYRRNFLICANLVQKVTPGDRVVVIYGSGHAYLMRQCVKEMPGLKLVEANDYLPKD